MNITIDAVFVTLVIVTAACAFFMLCIVLAVLLKALHAWVRKNDRDLQKTLRRELFGRRRP